MAVTSYREVVPRTFNHKFGESPTASIKYVCTLDGATNTQTILDHIGITFGSSHPEYWYLRCGSGQVTETDPYHAEVTYEYELPSQPSADYDESPLQRADVWSFTTGGIVVPVMRYYDGTTSSWEPLVNSAGELFEGVTAVEGEMKAQISGNRSAFPTGLALAATNRVNNASYAGGATGTWLCTGISGQQQVEVVNGSEFSYWAVTVTLSYRGSKHGVWLPNVGYNQLVDGELKPCTVEYLGDKIPASAPMPLDSTGAQKAAGEMPEVDYYETHMSADFNSLFGTPPT